MSKELYLKAKNPFVKKSIFDSLDEDIKKEILEEEQSGTSAIDTSTVGEFKVYDRIEKISKDMDSEKKKKILEEDEDELEIDFHEDSFDEIAELIASKITSDDLEGLDDDEVDEIIDDIVDKAFEDCDVWTPYRDYEGEAIEAENALIEESIAKEKAELEGKDFQTRFDAVMEEEKSMTDKMREKRRKSRQMKRQGGKMRSARKRKASKMDLATIKKRVHVQAIKAVKEKFASKQGKSYKNLPLAQQVKIDQKVKQKKALVQKFERKLLKKYRQEKKSKGTNKEEK